MLFQRDRAGYTFLGILCGCLLLSDRVASTDVLCGQYQNVTDPSGEYTINTNQWGKDDSGAQCISVNATETPSFSATWSWTANSSEVHSFPNVNLNDPLLPIELSNLSALTISFNWVMYPQFAAETSSSAVSKFDSSGLGTISTKANVALDMFMDSDPTKATTTTTPSHELMIWFGYIGEVLPIGYDFGPVGSHRMHGQQYSLYRGANANDQVVFTWLPQKNTTKLDNSDLTQLVHFLWVHDFIAESMFLGIIQFGTETIHTNGENVTFIANDITVAMEKGSPKINWSAGVGRAEDRMAAWCVLLVAAGAAVLGSGVMW